MTSIITTASPRVYQNHLLDSTRWQNIIPRDDDIVITTSYKSGTTWTQFIVYQLLFLTVPNPPLYSGKISSWVDCRFCSTTDELLENLEQQSHRRFLKSHLPKDGIQFSENTRYIVVGRDARDVFMSMINHWSSFTDEAYQMLNTEQPGNPFPQWHGDIQRAWQDWITRGWFDWESEGYPFWSNLHHTATWWPYYHLDNVLFVHYNELKSNLLAQVLKIAEFIQVDISLQQAKKIAEQSHFNKMKAYFMANIDSSEFWKKGAESFFHKGTNGRWANVLTAKDLELYQQTKSRLLPSDCAEWLEQKI